MISLTFAEIKLEVKNALIEKIKEIYPNLKSKDKKSFFKKVKISRISQEFEQKIKDILEKL